MTAGAAVGGRRRVERDDLAVARMRLEAGVAVAARPGRFGLGHGGFDSRVARGRSRRRRAPRPWRVTLGIGGWHRLVRSRPWNAGRLRRRATTPPRADACRLPGRWTRRAGLGVALGRARLRRPTHRQRVGRGRAALRAAAAGPSPRGSGPRRAAAARARLGAGVVVAALPGRLGLGRGGFARRVARGRSRRRRALRSWRITLGTVGWHRLVHSRSRNAGRTWRRADPLRADACRLLGRRRRRTGLGVALGRTLLCRPTRRQRVGRSRAALRATAAGLSPRGRGLRRAAAPCAGVRPGAALGSDREGHPGARGRLRRCASMRRSRRAYRRRGAAALASGPPLHRSCAVGAGGARAAISIRSGVGRRRAPGVARCVAGVTDVAAAPLARAARRRRAASACPAKRTCVAAGSLSRAVSPDRLPAAAARRPLAGRRRLAAGVGIEDGTYAPKWRCP